MVNSNEIIIHILKELNLIIIKSHYNHIFLYKKHFWKLHFKLFYLSRKNKRIKLYRPSLFLWLKFIPLSIILWYFFYFAILIIFNSSNETREFQFLINFPHTLLIAILYNYLSNKSLMKYYKKIKKMQKII